MQCYGVIAVYQRASVHDNRQGDKDEGGGNNVLRVPFDGEVKSTCDNVFIQRFLATATIVAYFCLAPVKSLGDLHSLFPQVLRTSCLSEAQI